ncbi:MAG: hypothetical protein QOI34_499 [Verrucomicrobiota bacterium]|jgi:hypothetical protein
MSDRPHELPVPEGEYFESNRFAGLSLLLAAVAFVALVLCVVGASVEPAQFGFSWLFAFGFFFTLCAGCFFWTIVHHAVDAEWSVVVRRQLENLACLFAVLAIFFLPVIFLRHHLYAWMNIPLGQDHVLDLKRAYLNWPFFLGRATFCFAFFITSSLLLRRFSVRQDKNGNPGFTLRMRKLSIISLPLFALCLTFGACDWLMSLNYTWFSTMWGVYIFAGAAGSSMSLLVLVVTGLRRAGYLQGVVSTEHYYFMGKWMLAFTVFWAYIAFSQYMLIWYANIPEETQYYLARTTQSWWILSTLLVFGRFFGPFAILLLQSIKKNPHQLCWVASWILCMQLLDIYIIVLPALHGTGVHLSVWDFVPLIGIGATLAFVYLRIVGRTSLFPLRDPRLIESVRIKN